MKNGQSMSWTNLDRLNATNFATEKKNAANLDFAYVVNIVLRPKYLGCFFFFFFLFFSITNIPFTLHNLEKNVKQIDLKKKSVIT